MRQICGDTVLGSPVLNKLRDVRSTCHLKMKFPTTIGVGEVRGEQVLAKEYYMQELKPTKMGIHAIEPAVGRALCNHG